ncbi:hypothetical protein DUT91_24705 [Phyllobacterium salinisoli]|uniref:Uncharacterized protein n=2 Tax=Phyllobacterium salinisoli TaxID=1899321 RepID=A0A368JWV1_9HYPH|nr:hypothetical protein DUT91_24705 [Phyllobacterium salinisoli]
MAANSISYLEIDAYCRLTGAVITPWELSLIRRLDLAALNARGKEARADIEATPADVQEAKLHIRGAAVNRRIAKRSAEQPVTKPTDI